MSAEHQELASLFEKASWHGVPLSDKAKCAGLEVVNANHYAVVGIVLGSEPSAATDWTECQVQMANLRKNADIGRTKDLYLLFVVDEIGAQDFRFVQSIVNDTHVCRKIFVERRGRSIAEAVLDVPVLTALALSANHSGLRKEERKATPIKLPDPFPEAVRLLEDLAQRSAGNIIDRGMAGEYSFADEDNET